MRRLVVASVALLGLILFVTWLVLPMFRFSRVSALGECERCSELLSLVPTSATVVVVVPSGGSSMFELGRRIVPSRDLAKALPAPGLIAVGLGDAPAVAWQDGDGLFGAAAAPSRARGLFVRLAAVWGPGRILTDADRGIFVVGEAGAGSSGWDLSRFDRLQGRSGHFFVRHERPGGQSVAVLGARTLDVTTLPDSPATGRASLARHPEGAALSLVVPDITRTVEPVEKILPLRTSDWSERQGQLIIYEIDGSGLLPSPRGILIVSGNLDPREIIERAVPRVDGVTRDSVYQVGTIEVVRRETLGVVVDAASKDGALALAFDGESMRRWIAAETREDDAPSVWSFASDPPRLDAALRALLESPGRQLLGGSSRRTLRRLGDVVGAFRNAADLRSRQVDTPGGPEIRSRIVW
jgi:hypothetical protein